MNGLSKVEHRQAFHPSAPALASSKKSLNSGLIAWRPQHEELLPAVHECLTRARVEPHGRKPATNPACRSRRGRTDASGPRPGVLDAGSSTPPLAGGERDGHFPMR